MGHYKVYTALFSPKSILRTHKACKILKENVSSPNTKGIRPLSTQSISQRVRENNRVRHQERELIWRLEKVDKLQCNSSNLPAIFFFLTTVFQTHLRVNFPKNTYCSRIYLRYNPGWRKQRACTHLKRVFCVYTQKFSHHAVQFLC